MCWLEKVLGKVEKWWGGVLSFLLNFLFWASLQQASAFQGSSTLSLFLFLWSRWLVVGFRDTLKPQPHKQTAEANQENPTRTLKPVLYSSIDKPLWVQVASSSFFSCALPQLLWDLPLAALRPANMAYAGARVWWEDRISWEEAEGKRAT